MTNPGYPRKMFPANYKPARKFSLSIALIDYWYERDRADDSPEDYQSEIYPAAIKRWIAHEKIRRSMDSIQSIDMQEI